MTSLNDTQRLAFRVAFLPVIISACSDDDDLIGVWYCVGVSPTEGAITPPLSRSVTKDI